MTLPFSWIASKDNITVVLNGKPKQIRLDTDQGKRLHNAVRKSPKDLDEIAQIADIATYVILRTQGRVTIDDRDTIRLDGEPVDFGLAQIILWMFKDGSDISHLMKFVENIAVNPNSDVANHVYSFLEKGGMPITPDGYFLAYKRVDSNYRSFTAGSEECTVTKADGSTDLVTGHIPHTIDTSVSMDRALCDPNRNQTCSVGLHFCSFEYLSQYHQNQGRIVIVKINPADVTAIPNDYNDAKGRTCRLEIVGEVSEDAAKEYFPKAVDERHSPVTVVTPDPVDSGATKGWTDYGIESAALLTAKPDVPFIEHDGEVDPDDDIGAADGRQAADEASACVCNPYVSPNYHKVMEQADEEYCINFAEAFANRYSERVTKNVRWPHFDAGYSDGERVSAKHKALEKFDPEPIDELIPSDPADHDSYLYGFLRGYIAERVIHV